MAMTYDLPLIAGELFNPAENPSAACIGHVDPEVFFPSPTEDAEPGKSLCRTCPIADECRRWAIATRQSGIWDGELLDRGKPEWANTKWRNPYPRLAGRNRLSLGDHGVFGDPVEESRSVVTRAGYR